MKRFLRGILLIGLGSAALCGVGMLLFHYDFYFLSFICWVTAVMAFAFLVLMPAFHSHVLLFWKWETLANRHYNEVKKKAEVIREAYRQSRVVALGKPTQRYEFERFGGSYDYGFDYLPFLLPWSRELFSFDYNVEEHLDTDELAYLSEEFVTEEEFKYSREKRHEILVFEDKELIVLDRNVYAFSDLLSYNIWDDYRSHVVHDTVTRVDTDTQNRRMAAGYMLGGMKGVYLAQMSPATTTSTTSRVVFSGALHLGITVKDDAQQSKSYYFIMDNCKGGSEKKKALLEFLRTCNERNIHKL